MSVDSSDGAIRNIELGSRATQGVASIETVEVEMFKEDKLPKASSTAVGIDVVSREYATAEEDVVQLEALTTVASAPAYSAFSKGQKRFIVFMITFAAFLSPTSANIYFPALNPLSVDLRVSTKLINLTLTSYMIFQGLSPTIFGDLGDMIGRRPAYILAFVIYLCANVGLALQGSYTALFLLRCLQSTGSSGAIALGFGVVADVASSSERGSYMGIVNAGTMLGPTVGPVIGGILVEFLGWRAIFWFLVITASVWLIAFTLFVPETGRNVVGNGSVPPPKLSMTVLSLLHQRRLGKKDNQSPLSHTEQSAQRVQAEPLKTRKFRWPNPLNTLRIVVEKDVALILVYNALIYTAFYDVVATIPSLFLEIYGFNDLVIGLCYIPFGAGCALASFINGKMLDRNYKRVARQIGFTIDRKRGDDMRHFPIERARIELIWPMLGVGLATYLCYGWVLEKNVFLAWPLILQFILGFCVNGSFNILGVLLVDLYPQRPATATAANNLVRCFMGAAGTGVIDLMISGMGRGWCFTFIALVCIVASPMLLVVLKYGPQWREERAVRMEKAVADVKANEHGSREVTVNKTSATQSTVPSKEE